MFLNHQLYGSFDDIFSSLPISLPVLVMLPCFFCLHNYPFGFLHSTLSSWVCLQPFTHLPSLLRRSPSCCTEPSVLLPADLVWVPRGRHGGGGAPRHSRERELDWGGKREAPPLQGLGWVGVSRGKGRRVCLRGELRPSGRTEQSWRGGSDGWVLGIPRKKTEMGELWY